MQIRRTFKGAGSCSKNAYSIMTNSLMMKKYKYISIFLLISCIYSNADLLVSDGNPFVFAFTPDDFVQQNSVPDGPHELVIKISEKENLQDPVWLNIVTVRLFHDGETSPFHSFTHAVSGEAPVVISRFRGSIDLETGAVIIEPGWPDQTGAVEISTTAQDVTYSIENISVNSFIGDRYVSASIPEPSTIGYFMASGCVLFLSRKRMRG